MMIRSRPATDAYRKGWEATFAKDGCVGLNKYCLSWWVPVDLYYQFKRNWDDPVLILGQRGTERGLDAFEVIVVVRAESEEKARQKILDAHGIPVELEWIKPRWNPQNQAND